MRIQFEILAELIIQHDFYLKKIEKGLKLFPTQPTITALQNQGLLFKQTEAGGVILYEVDTTASSSSVPLKTLPEDLVLSFYLLAENPYVYNYSAFPLGFKAPHLFHLSNLNATTETVDGKTYHLLSKNAYLGEDDVVELHQQRFAYRTTETAANMLLEVKDIADQPIYNTSEKNNGSDLFELAVDMKDQPEALYKVSLNGADSGHWYISDQLYQKKPLALIELHCDSSLPANFRLQNGTGDIQPKTFYLRIAARKNTWKYYVVLKSLETDPGFSISYSNPDNSKPEEKPYPSGVNFAGTAPDTTISEHFGAGKVLLFQSSKEIPYFEYAKKSIKLEKLNGGGTETVIKNLPNADVAAVKTNTANTESYSEIFIYI